MMKKFNIRLVSGPVQGEICWSLYKQIDMEIFSTPLNLLNAGSSEQELSEANFLKAIQGQSELAEAHVLMNLLKYMQFLTTDVWLLFSP